MKLLSEREKTLLEDGRSDDLEDFFELDQPWGNKLKFSKALTRKNLPDQLLLISL